MNKKTALSVKISLNVTETDKSNQKNVDSGSMGWNSIKQKRVKASESLQTRQ